MTAGAVAIGVDVGGTRLRVAAVDGRGRMVARADGPRPAGTTPSAFGRALLDDLPARIRELGPDLPVGIGIAALASRDGTLVDAPNLPVAGLALGARAREALGVPVTVLNDATAACLGEARAGAAAGVPDVVMVTVGTGIGGGAVVDGRLLRGAGGLAAEFGHLVVDPDGRRCPCGADGCLEAYASGRALGVVAAERLADGEESSALAREPVVDGAAVGRAAAGGDALATEVVDRAGGWLAIGIADLVNAFDPAVVVVGGGAGQGLGELLLAPARRALPDHVLGRDHRPMPDLVLAELGDDAGVVGAALAAIELD